MNRVFMTFAAVVVAFGLVACTGTGTGSLVPIKAVGTASGDLSGPQVFIAGVPVNALVKVHGEIAYTVQPVPPYLTYDGDYTIIVEPLPGKEAEAQAAVTRGDILIRRAGIPGALNAPGTRDAYIASLIAASKARAAAQPAPAPAPEPRPGSEPPPPPPPPAPPVAAETTHSSPDPVALAKAPCCTGKECEVPGAPPPCAPPPCVPAQPSPR